MATIEKRGKTWRAQVRRKGYPAISRSFDTKSNASIWSRDIERDMDRGTFIDRSEAESTTLKQALKRYLKEITPSKKGAKQETDRIKAWMKRPLSEYSLVNIHGAELANYRDQRLKEGKSPSTIRNEINIISHLYTIAKKEWGMECLTNPVQNIRMPKQSAGRERRLKEGEEEALLNAAVYPLKQMIILALETGMRLGEIQMINWKRIDVINGVLILDDTKNGERRSVPLSLRARTILMKLKEKPKHITGRVFPDVSNSAISHNFRNLCSRLEIEGLRFHDLRHEATSRLFEKELDLMAVASVTGHKTLHMLKRYTHLKVEDLAKKLG